MLVKKSKKRQISKSATYNNQVICVCLHCGDFITILSVEKTPSMHVCLDVYSACISKAQRMSRSLSARQQINQNRDI